MEEFPEEYTPENIYRIHTSKIAVEMLYYIPEYTHVFIINFEFAYSTKSAQKN